MNGRTRLPRSDTRHEQLLRITKRKSLLGILAVTSNQSTLLVSANVIPSSPILVALMMEAIRSSETSVLTSATRRNVPEDGIHFSHCRGNLKPYIALTACTL
jgi:hypothetical protein